MANVKQAQQYRHQASNNPIETGKSSVSQFSNEFKQHVASNARAGAEDLFNQLIGGGEYASSNQPQFQEMQPGEEFVLPKKSPAKELVKPERKPAIAAAIDYHAEIARGSERKNRRENQEIQYQIQQVMEELQRLVSSSDKIIQMAYGDVNVASTPTTVGKYHTNFFSWMLTVVRTARQKVEDSGAWLAAAKGKGGKKGYWGMFKQHGTTFGQSGERNVSTQTG